MNKKRYGAVQKKVLLLLASGLALGLSHNPRQQWRVVSGLVDEWKTINRRSLLNSIDILFTDKILSRKEISDGVFELVITKEGEKVIQQYSVDKLQIKIPKKWDGRWRILMYDIPSDRKRLRDVFRFHIKRMGMVEVQKSVFISPYPCFEELRVLFNHYRIRKYARLFIAQEVDQEQNLIKKFKLK